MKEIERLLYEKKAELDEIEVPVELEERLKNALEGKTFTTKRRNNWLGRIAAVCLITLLVGYNFNTLAFYGKRLIGYDQIMNGTLKQLNELGKGQIIGKSYTFESGITMTLDGIMIDENQLLAFYSLKDAGGGMEAVQIPPQMHMEGLWRNYMMESGQGEIDDDNKETKWITSFEPPRFYERKLNLKFRLIDRGIVEEGEISFKLDREKAMGSTLKKNIKRTFKFGETQVRLESIIASPTRTVINGSIQNIFQLARDHISGNRLRPNHIAIKLMVNGEEVPSQGAGMRTDLKGITFHQEFDALPEDLQSLELHLQSLSVDRDVSEAVNLPKDIENKSISILDQDVQINKIYQSNGSSFVTITTEEGTILTRVYLLVDGNKIALSKTVTDELIKQENGEVLHTRTLDFPATGEKYQFIIERITYTEIYNEVIDIPIK
ncbi:DUF4179 domain-containing protein [Clostridium formicaceticum]|uniref:DUF4179 domain-containing protein n=1 Tax=Clostridium formicaceticum TaxID=1497 RepID=A0AAC9RNY0_9CLOT|nr:DUF4179 domain-containing protein [Clostridium formicaceticum]AOY77734.1 hypothetical protein BJL90_18850 [Clostridium formicaceticum]ARE88328.1 hypothetical protein CLFO_27290 [Clostridium formicaceticum]